MTTSASTEPRRTKPPRRTPSLDRLYCINEDGSRNTIHPADVQGRYQRRKKVVWALLIAIYLALPWIEIGGRPAVLIDIAQRDFYLFGATFNAQDFYLVFFVLTGIGFALFVISALFGRVWCGYSCPHTVFLEGVYRRIERWVEGGAAQRRKLAAMPWNARKILKRGAKWLAFAVVSIFLSHSFLSYFIGVEGVRQAVTNPPSVHPVAFSFVVITTLLVYFDFAWFREQLCIVLCPYGRLQGVLYDDDTINVTYDRVRGEPRGRYTERDRGDCIDCQRCIAVCPTGIDIRNGTQMECIGCANCIDACDAVMDKVGQPRGLIRYDSERGVEQGVRRFVRPRLFLYGALLLVGLAVSAVAMLGRTPFEANILRQQSTPYEILESTDQLRNAYFVHLVNKQPERRTFLLEPVAQDGVEFLLPMSRVELDSLAGVRAPFFVTVDRDHWKLGATVALRIRTADGDFERVVDTTVLGPR